MKLIAFSLWGSADRYCQGAVNNAKIAKTIYKGWRCRFYYRDVPQEIIDKLVSEDAEIVECSGEDGMFWRFRPAGDPNIERFISRDTDSILNWREKAAVDAWISSGKLFHIMRDNYYHGMPMMGGMWGCVGGTIPEIGKQISEWAQRNSYNDDQLFLERNVWPLAQNSMLCHDSCPLNKWNGRKYPESVPFPRHKPLTQGSFVGDYVW